MRRRTFRGARCLVTGASSGLGRALSEHLSRVGARVLLTGRSPVRLAAVAESLMLAGIPPDFVPTVIADLTETADRDRVIVTAQEKFGALDLVINAAGVGATGHFDTHDPTILRSIFAINLFALIELTRGLLPLLRRGNSPLVVNVGSIVARRGLPGRSEYSASKFAVAGFTEAIRAEWAKFAIDVMLLNPGFTATEFEQNLLINTARVPTAHKRLMTADQVRPRHPPGHPPGPQRIDPHHRRPPAPAGQPPLPPTRRRRPRSLHPSPFRPHQNPNSPDCVGLPSRLQSTCLASPGD